ncbi:two-component sensor histidine kinase [Paenibacillus sp. 598K]|uniref:cache domain-containing sensor histidine kinase n=1 Tax=Paenibacillus sp. 598K TaxID=1117987 RepID=UPI000FF9714F|nr:sensor histidine kinase [Paenibacillus sp. 598K]GBF75196.1 two-component sensor histidine kinase [Paenibacillus sp. 598K]
MWRLFDRFKYNGLFVKMFLIMVVSIVAVAITVTWTTISMSERVFMNTFSLTNSKIIGQIEAAMDTYNYSVILTANGISQSGITRNFLTQEEEGSLAQNNSYYRMGRLFSQISTGLEAYEVGIYITGTNGRSYATERTFWPITDRELREHPATKRALDEPRRLIYQYDDPRRPGIVDSEPAVIATKAIVERSSGSAYGVIYFSMLEKEFRRFYSSFTTPGNDVAIMGSDGTVISSNREEWLGLRQSDWLTYALQMQEEGEPFLEVDIDGRDSIVVANYNPAMNLYILNMIDKQIALGQFVDSDTIILWVIAIVAAALIIVFLISRRLTRSLSLLVKQISTISKYEFDHHVSATGSYETRQLANAFNAMMDELQDYVGQLVHTQKRQRNAELSALQQQINPHFLYNTLASVKFMVQQGSKEKAAETINALISLLQNAIGNMNETVTVSQEMANLRNYVFINHVRYGERIKVNYFISPDCMGYLMPKLMIQPFIENAFFHGFNRKSEGHIYIMVSRDGDALLCEIVDNGDGMVLDGDSRLPASRGKRQQFSGIGVRNVHERIRLLYGEGYGVVISSEIGEGTKVRIRIPLLEV